MLSLSGEAVAQQSASARAMLEEVVVTARRREENLQDLPLSIQAITADAMQAQGIYNIQQITDFAPNVVLSEDVRKNDTRFFVPASAADSRTRRRSSVSVCISTATTCREASAPS
jgi:iron complex outermembrane receptor protein